MPKIRSVNYFDKFKLKKIISYLSDDAINHYTKVFNTFPLSLIHNFLPLAWKFLPESFVMVDGKDIMGMITASPKKGNPYKLGINRLFLEHDYFNTGKQLIEYVIARYGARGATSFFATIDESYDELLDLFSSGCGFRQCSCEQLWRFEELRFDKQSSSFIRPFKNSDAKTIAEIFNDNVITHFKYTVSTNKKEYYENFFKGLSEGCEFKFVVEEENKIKAYFSLSETDGNNFILDIISSNWHETSIDDILKFAHREISKRQKNFTIFVKIRKYMQSADDMEKYLLEKGAKCIQTQILLVKDFYKIIKEPETSRKIVLFNEIKEKPVFKI